LRLRLGGRAKDLDVKGDGLTDGRLGYPGDKIFVLAHQAGLVADESLARISTFSSTHPSVDPTQYSSASAKLV
jgi:hypothetical protein